jgi:methionine aminopeptidase
MRIKLKRPKEIVKMRDAGRLVAECFAILEASVQPGARLSDLDEEVEAYLAQVGTRSATASPTNGC